MPFKLNSL